MSMVISPCLKYNREGKNLLFLLACKTNKNRTYYVFFVSLSIFAIKNLDIMLSSAKVNIAIPRRR